MAFYTQRPLTDDLRARMRAQVKHAGFSPFSAPWLATIDLFRRECDHLTQPGKREVVLMIDITEGDLRLDGELRANAKPMSPNVAVALETATGPLIFPCGRFHSWQDNVRAIALGMEALRRVDRYGISPTGEQYRGWQALPPGVPMPAAMTVDEARRFLGEAAGSDVPASPTNFMALFHEAVKRHHPDNGGDAVMFDKVVKAKDLLAVS